MTNHKLPSVPLSKPELMEKSLENVLTRTHLRTTFSSAQEALALAVPTDKPFVEYYQAAPDSYFGIRIMRQSKRTGRIRRSWICRYRDSEGRDVKPMLMAAEERNYEDARWEAMKLKRDARGRREAGIPAMPTVFKAYEVYVKEGRKRWAKSTIRMYEAAGVHLLKFGLMRANQLQHTHLAELIDEIEASVRARHAKFKEKNSEMTGEAAAHRVMRVIRAIYADLIEDGIVLVNPTAKLARRGYFDRQAPKQDAVHRRDFPQFWHWLMQDCHRSTRDYILCALFMAFRRSLLDGLTWALVDSTTRSYTIPADAEGNKAKRKIIFPIPNWLWEHVFEARRLDGDPSPWIIPSPKVPGRSYRSIRGALAGLKMKTGIALTTHGLRRTAATLMSAATSSDLLAARLLTHKLDAAGLTNTNSSGYIITTSSDMREAMDKTTAFALEMASPKPG